MTKRTVNTIRMRTVIMYARVSTITQAATGVSLDAQVATLRAWAAANGHTVGGVCTDALSGTSADDRPGLQQALDRVCAERGILAVAALSRLARSTADALAIASRLEAAGGDLYSASEAIDTATPAGRFVFRLLSSLAELEVDMVRERTLAALAHMRALGQRVSGKLPYGYDLGAGGMLVPNGPEQRAIAAMRQWRAAGASWSAIATRLTAAGTPSKYGKTWRGDAVRQVVERAARDTWPARAAG